VSAVFTRQHLFLAIPEPWTENAMCNGRPTDDYDVDRLPVRGYKRHHEAQKLCRGCPVIGDCAWWAYRTESVGYVFAGVPVPIQRHESQMAQLYSIAQKRLAA
jgi:hypothetical protein